MNFFYWLTSSFFKVGFTCFYRNRIYGVENFPEGPALIASNHLSFLDPPLIGASAPEEVHFLAREGLFKVPILRTLIRNLNSYPVGQTEANIESFKLVTKLIKEGKKVAIFPEGERSRDGALLPMKQGIGMLALRCKCPIIPTYIQGTFEAWPRHKKYPKLFGKTVCIFGKPIAIKPYLEMDKREAKGKIAEDVGKAIADLREWYLNR